MNSSSFFQTRLIFVGFSCKIDLAIEEVRCVAHLRVRALKGVSKGMGTQGVDLNGLAVSVMSNALSLSCLRQCVSCLRQCVSCLQCAVCHVSTMRCMSCVQVSVMRSVELCICRGVVCRCILLQRVAMWCSVEYVSVGTY